MEFVQLDIVKDDLDKSAELIIDTEPGLFHMFFGKNQKKAKERIIKLIKRGNNFYGYNHIYLAIKEDKILGLSVFYKGDQINKRRQEIIFMKTLDVFCLIRLLFVEKFFINRLITTKYADKELYISNICVDNNNRGKGVGKYILENIIKYAKSKDCDSIILDVTKNNKKAISLYEKYGFKKIKERRSKLFKVTIFKMSKPL